MYSAYEYERNDLYVIVRLGQRYGGVGDDHGGNKWGRRQRKGSLMRRKHAWRSLNELSERHDVGETDAASVTVVIWDSGQLVAGNDPS